MTLLNIFHNYLISNYLQVERAGFMHLPGGSELWPTGPPNASFTNGVLLDTATGCVRTAAAEQSGSPQRPRGAKPEMFTI